MEWASIEVLNLMFYNTKIQLYQLLSRGKGVARSTNSGTSKLAEQLSVQDLLQLGKSVCRHVRIQFCLRIGLSQRPLDDLIGI